MSLDAAAVDAHALAAAADSDPDDAVGRSLKAWGSIYFALRRVEPRG
jgi:hypothetical protein